MSKFLHGPSTLLVLAAEPTRRDRLVDVLDSHAFPPWVTRDEVLAAEGADHEKPVTVVDTDSAAGVLEHLESDESIGCVVVADDVARERITSLVTRVRDRSPDLPVVVYAADGDEALASASTRVGASAYVPARRPDGERTDDALLETVEDALREYDRRYRNETESEILDAILADLDVSIYVKDDAARHLKLADIAGGPNPEDAIGKTDADLYADDDETAEEALADDMAIIQDGEEVTRKEEVWGSEDAKIWFQTSKRQWRDRDGEVRGLFGITYEITELKERIRDLELMNRRLEDFASFVSHDLRNPLTVASGNLELARLDVDHDALADVADALERMESMIDELGSVSQDSVSSFAGVDAVRLPHLVSTVWESVAPDDATLVVDLPAATVLNANEQQLHPLFENLFKNAVEHAGPHATVRIGAREDGFFVEDDGPGIAPDRREKVFDEGFTTTDDGTGTGLTIVADVADSHAWDLSVAEGSEGGARFEFGNCMITTDPDPGRIAEAWTERGQPRSLDATAVIGEPEQPGDASRDEVTGTWTVRASGRDIWQYDDELRFVYARVSGPVRLEGRVTAFDAPAEYSKAGFMLRDDLSANAPLGYVGRIGTERTEVLWRAARDAPTRSQQLDRDGLDEEWYRIEYVDDRVTTFVSEDRETWHCVDQRTVTYEGQVHAGLVVSSAMYDELATATFEDVTLTELPDDE